MVFILTRQVPFMRYSFLMNISLGIILLISLYHFLVNKNIIKKEMLLFVIFIIILSIYSIFLANEINNIIRFALILIFILLAYLVKPKEIYVKIFLFFSLIQSLFIISLEIFFLYYGHNDLSFFSRNTLLSSGFGDIYSPYGGMWKIQLKGNALLPFAFFVSIVYFKNKKRLFYSFFFVISSIFAGNFAFILGISFFIIFYNFLFFRMSKNKFFIYITITLFFVIMSITPIINFVQHTIESKAVNSNTHRIFQSKVLLDNLSESTTSILFGQGIGNSNINSSYGNFNDTIYFELQTLYILNQLGFFPFLLYLLINIYLAIFFIRYNKLLFIYITYVFYAIWNPYIWDTNHIVVIIVLISLKRVFDEKNLRNISCI